MRRLVVDIETNGLTPSKVWCIVTEDLATGTVRTFDHWHVEDAIRHLQQADMLILHNGCGFDLPVLYRLWGFVYKGEVYDTMLMSRMLCPDRGYHSLEGWGNKLGILKLPDLDWNVWDKGLIDRCVTDVKITTALYHTLKREEGVHDWVGARQLEQLVSTNHSQQAHNGVMFDTQEANYLADYLTRELAATIRLIMAVIPLRVVQHLATISVPFCVDGSYKKSVADWYDGGEVWGAFNRVRIEQLNLASSIQVKAYLLQEGWVPTEYTEKGSPRLTEDSYGSIKGGMGRLLAKKNVLTHRLNMVRNPKGDKGFVYMVREDGRIAADAITLGAATGRYAHIGVANLPRPTTLYGKEIRSLFCVPKGKVMLGWDLCGIENRVAAHYLSFYDGGVFAEEVLEGDFHQTTADSLGITRDEAKTFRYMTLYGGRPKKIAATMGWKLKKASQVYKAFWLKEKALSSLQKALEAAVCRGWVKGLDGRKLYPRSKHALINFLFQSAATIVFKRAMVLMNEKLLRAQLPYKQLITYHDEVQLEVDECDVTTISEVVHASVKEAGEWYKLSVPIAADVSVGHNWAETH